MKLEDLLESLVSDITLEHNLTGPGLRVSRFDQSSSILEAVCDPSTPDSEVQTTFFSHRLATRDCNAWSLQRINTPNFPNGKPNPRLLTAEDSEDFAGCEVRLYFAVHMEQFCTKGTHGATNERPH